MEVDELLRAAEGAGFPIARDELDAAVAEPTKRRYAYDETGTRIRAVQGHSVSVELGYAPSSPPAELFHGTHPGAVDAILAEGLKPMQRQHVHLSPDVRDRPRASARAAASRSSCASTRRGWPPAGAEFFRADNGVWLVRGRSACARRRRVGRRARRGRPSRRRASPRRA